MKGGRIRRGLVTAGAAALLLVPAVPASATTMAETCHPPRYDTWACVCGAVARTLTKLTGDPWYCVGA